MITCRTATLEDLPVLYEFEQEIIAFERPYDSTLKEGQLNYYDIKAMILSETAIVIVAVNDTEIVGSAYAKIKAALPYLNHENFAYLGFMFVKPTYRGQGINQLIIEELKMWTKSKGLKELRLNVYYDNDSALRAYEKSGFVRHRINMRMEID
jgi:GNAT superfamily N-acetyltransferase